MEQEQQPTGQQQREITGKEGPRKERSYKPKAYYKAAQLLKQIKKSTNKVSSNLKGTKVCDMECTVFEIMRYTSFACDDKENYEKTLHFLTASIEALEDVMLSARILLDLGQIKSSGYSEITRLEGNLSKQLSAWRGATIKRIENKK